MRQMLAEVLRRWAERLDLRQDRLALAFDQLALACRLFTQGLGDETAYYDSLGADKTQRALHLMRMAGVEPVYFDPALRDGDDDEEST